MMNTTNPRECKTLDELLAHLSRESGLIAKRTPGRWDDCEHRQTIGLFSSTGLPFGEFIAAQTDGFWAIDMPGNREFFLSALVDWLHERCRRQKENPSTWEGLSLCITAHIIEAIDQYNLAHKECSRDVVLNALIEVINRINNPELPAGMES